MSKRRKSHRIFDDEGVVFNRGTLLLLQLTGIGLFGVAPIVLFRHRLLEILFGTNSTPDLAVLICGCLVMLAIIVASIIAEKKYSLTKWDKDEAGTFNAPFLIYYLILRILFLIAYELWFRGFLLFESIHAWGAFIAIPLNVALYTLLHYVNGKDEMRGCIPLGLMLCIMCTWVGAAWPAIAVHVAFCVSYEGHVIRKINKPSISIA
jgi:membrane protease YdiL (CAAX protease family)